MQPDTYVQLSCIFMKVAVLCVGLGRVRRGFERFTDDLGNHLRDEVDLQVFGSRGGQATTDIVEIPCLSRDGVGRFEWIARHDRGPYYWECLSFLVAALPRLMNRRYDLIHIMDSPIVNFLYHLRRLPGVRDLSKRILFTNANGMHDPVCCNRAAVVQMVAKVPYEESLSYLDPARVLFVPYAIDVHKLEATRVSRSEARATLGIDQSAFVVLSVSALNRGHKRSHHLIGEVAKVPDAVLLNVGRVEDETLPELGRKMLGDRFINRTIDFNGISLMYAAADVFALTSLIEGFALSVVEAIVLSVPVLVHDNDHFRWLVRDEDCLVDMSQPGALADKLEQIRKDPPSQDVIEDRRQKTADRFSWPSLKDDYVKMYERALELV